MKIQFIQQHIVRGQTREEDVTYEEGQIADFGKDRVGNTYAQAYIERGYAVEVDEAADRAREKTRADAARATARLEARGRIAIPSDVLNLKDTDVIQLGQSLSDDPVKTKDDALRAIETEKVRRRSPT
jgi:hypothetical protein